MLYNHKTALKKYGTHREIMQAINRGKLVKLERNIYTTLSDYSKFEYIVTKYPKIVFTMQSVFFYLGLCKKEPKLFQITSNRTAIRIKEKYVTQYYQFNKFFNIGIMVYKVNNLNIRIYNKERMLIELIRNRNKIDVELFNEVMTNYYKERNNLDKKKLINYLKKFNAKNKYLKIINEQLDMNLVI